MFQSELVVKRDISKTNAWELIEPLVWDSNDYKVTVPKGFVFDFASVPWLFQSIFPKSGRLYDRASCLHDYIYVTKLFDRKTCDKLFYLAMLSDGVAKWRAWLMYQATRLGGWWVYHNIQNKV